MGILSILLCLLLLTGCAPAPSAPTASPTLPVPPPSSEPPVTAAPTLPPETLPPDPVEQCLKSLTIEERVGQLFLARCNADTALQDIESYGFGGFILFRSDFQEETPDSLRDKLSRYQAASRVPLLLAVDEEGGTVNRISVNSTFRSSPFPSLRSLYDSGGLEAVLEMEEEKCLLLKDLGLNVNMGPVCDITTDPGAFMYRRSLGQDAQTTALVAGEVTRLMNRQQIGSVLKHFPGYGNNADTHTGIAIDSRSLSQLRSNDLVPFSSGILSGCGSILMSHTIVEALDPDLPVSLSPEAHAFLRQELGFQGVIMTDDLVMQAITDAYGSGEAAVLAVLAGNDLLCSTDYQVQYEAVLEAVLEGRISFDALNDAVRRVLRWKQDLGLIS